MRNAQPTIIEGTDETGPTDREEGFESHQESATGTTPTAVRTVPPFLLKMRSKMQLFPPR